MSLKIMKGICWMILEMGSTLKYITLKPSSLGVNISILVYLSVYTSFPLCHQLAYQVYPWLVDVNEVFSLLTIHRWCQSSYKKHGFFHVGHLLTRGPIGVFRWHLSRAINK
jgi:hypothetical protein